MEQNGMKDGVRTGIFCGSFNPIHLGHTALLAAASAQLGLTGAVLVPVNDDYWKPGCRYEAAEHRLRMCALAVEGLCSVRISDLETRTAGTVYTADTVERLARESPGGRFFLLMGGDTARYVHRWTRFARLREHVTFVLAERGGGAAAARRTLAGAGADCVSLNWTPSPISSTAIRRELRQSGRAEGLDERVLAYIRAHGLYETEALKL